MHRSRRNAQFQASIDVNDNRQVFDVLNVLAGGLCWVLSWGLERMLQSAGLFVVEVFIFKSPLYFWTQWAKIIFDHIVSLFLQFPLSSAVFTIIFLK